MEDILSVKYPSFRLSLYIFSDCRDGSTFKDLALITINCKVMNDTRSVKDSDVNCLVN